MNQESIWLKAGFLPLAENIYYFPKGDMPLSAEVFLIPGEECIWFFDAGNGERTLQAIRSIPGRKRAVISHFHPDHMGNTLKAGFDTVYMGDFAFRKVKNGENCVCVTQPLSISDGLSLSISPLPSSHAKGSLMLEAGDMLFLGDGLYSCMKNGKAAYNATVLRETLRTLEGTRAEYFVFSHQDKLVQPRAQALAHLREIYAARRQNEPFILL